MTTLKDAILDDRSSHPHDPPNSAVSQALKQGIQRTRFEIATMPKWVKSMSLLNQEPQHA